MLETFWWFTETPSRRRKIMKAKRICGAYSAMVMAHTQKNMHLQTETCCCCSTHTHTHTHMHARRRTYTHTCNVEKQNWYRKTTDQSVCPCIHLCLQAPDRIASLALQCLAVAPPCSPFQSLSLAQNQGKRGSLPQPFELLDVLTIRVLPDDTRRSLV